jgi:hypothetical protein
MAALAYGSVFVPLSIIFRASRIRLIAKTTLVKRLSAKIEKLMIRVHRAFGQQCVTGLRSDRLEAVDSGAEIGAQGEFALLHAPAPSACGFLTGSAPPPRCGRSSSVGSGGQCESIRLTMSFSPN